MIDQSELYKNDSTIRQESDGNWYHYPSHGRAKLALVIASFVVLIAGGIIIRDPMGRLLFGNKAEARVTQVIRKEPGEPDELIRYRKKIEEGSHLTKFFYELAVDEDDGSQRELKLAVASLGKPFLNVNDTPTVIYYDDDDIAFELYEQRTWAFGVGFLFAGLVMLVCTIPMYIAAGKPILIDPESSDSEA